MRVLVDKDAAFGELRAPDDALYFREENGRAWKKHGPRSRVASRRGKIELDGVVTDASGAYFRGGVSTRAPIEVGPHRYPGALRLTARENSLLLTNIVPLELYLAGTVGSEMPPGWPLEALKAQAVASRSYALYMHAHPRDPLYDLDRTVLDQVYGGAKKGMVRVEKALAETRDEVLVYGDAVVKAYYHSRCGGSTDAPEAVWGRPERGPFGTVPCEPCRRTPSPWSTFVSWEELKRKLEVPFATEWFEKRWPSGRLAWLSLPKTNARWSGETLRKVLGYGRLKSTQFRWSASAAGVFVDGVGFGHGVGMCQWGARAMALAGADYRRILSHYYPGARVARASDVTRAKKPTTSPAPESARTHTARRQ